MEYGNGALQGAPGTHFQGSAGTGTLSSSEIITLAHVNQLQFAFARERNENTRRKAACEQLEEQLRNRDNELAVEQKRVELLTLFALGDGEPSNILLSVLTWISEVCPDRSVSLKCCVKTGEVWNVIEPTAGYYPVIQDNEFNLFGDSLPNRDPVWFPRQFTEKTDKILLTIIGGQAHIEGALFFSVCPRCVWMIIDNDRAISPYSHSINAEQAVQHLYGSLSLLETASQLMMSSVVRYLEKIELTAETMKSELFDKLTSALYIPDGCAESTLRSQWATLPQLISSVWTTPAYCSCELFMITSQPSGEQQALVSSQFSVEVVPNARSALLTAAVQQNRTLISSFSAVPLHETIDFGPNKDMACIIAVPIIPPDTRESAAELDTLSGGQKFGVVLRFQKCVSKHDIRCADAIAGAFQQCIYQWAIISHFRAFACVSGTPVMVDEAGAASTILGDSEFAQFFRKFLHSDITASLEDNQRILTAICRKLNSDWIVFLKPRSDNQVLLSGDNVDFRRTKPLNTAGFTVIGTDGAVHSVSVNELKGPVQDYILRSTSISSNVDIHLSTDTTMTAGFLSEVDVLSCGLTAFISTRTNTYAHTSLVVTDLPSWLHHCIGISFTVKEMDGSQSPVVFISGRCWSSFSQVLVNKSLSQLSSVLDLIEECRCMRKLFQVTDDLKKQISAFEMEMQREQEFFFLQEKLHNIRSYSGIAHSSQLNNQEAVLLRISFGEAIQAYCKASFLQRLVEEFGDVTDICDCRIICSENSQTGLSKLWQLSSAGDWIRAQADEVAVARTRPNQTVPDKSISPQRGIIANPHSPVATSKLSNARRKVDTRIVISAPLQQEQVVPLESNSATARMVTDYVDNSLAADCNDIRFIGEDTALIPLLSQDCDALSHVSEGNHSSCRVSIFLLIRTVSRSASSVLLLPRDSLLSSLQIAVGAFALRWDREFFGSNAFIEELLVSSDAPANSTHLTQAGQPTNTTCSLPLSVGCTHFEQSLLRSTNGMDYYLSGNFSEQLSLIVPHFFVSPVKIRNDTLLRNGNLNSVDGFEVLDPFNSFKPMPQRISTFIIDAALNHQNDGHTQGKLVWLTGLGESVYHYYSNFTDVAGASSSGNPHAILYTLDLQHPGVGYVQFIILPRSEKLIVPSHYNRLLTCLNELLLPLVLSLLSSPMQVSTEAAVAMLSASAKNVHLAMPNAVDCSSTDLEVVAQRTENDTQNGGKNNTLNPTLYHHPMTRKDENFFIGSLTSEVMKQWITKGSVLLSRSECIVRSAGFVLQRSKSSEDVMARPSSPAQKQWMLGRCCGDSSVPDVVSSERGLDVQIPSTLSIVSHSTETLSSGLQEFSLPDMTNADGSRRIAASNNSGYWIEWKVYDIDLRSPRPTHSESTLASDGTGLFSGTLYDYVRVVAVFVVAERSVNDLIHLPQKRERPAIAAAVFCICSTDLPRYVQNKNPYRREPSPGKPSLPSKRLIAANKFRDNEDADNRRQFRINARIPVFNTARSKSPNALKSPRSPSRATTSSKYFSFDGAEGEEAEVRSSLRQYSSSVMGGTENDEVGFLRAKISLVNVSRVFGGYLHSILTISMMSSEVVASLRTELSEECSIRANKQATLNDIVTVLQGAGCSGDTLTSGTKDSTENIHERRVALEDTAVLQSVRHVVNRWQTAETAVRLVTFHLSDIMSAVLGDR
jgi:hypothetical protein